VYGELTGKREAAQDYFLQQAAYVEDIQKDSGSSEEGKKTVVFFYINEAGGIVTRKTNDYVPKMIGLAGGEYIFADLGTEDASATTSVNMTMDEFYAGAKDADVLIYNGTIDNALQSVDELLDKNALFADFKSVQQGQVWCCNKYMYQATDQVGSITMELHLLLTQENATGLEFFYRVE
jgi:iron complex transport system substrate-binding protein